MKIGLIDVDGRRYPNLALMKLSAWHKLHGDDVEWCLADRYYDRVYQSKVFDETYSSDIGWFPQADEIIKGGTGYGTANRLPDEVEHTYPDYGLYPDLTADTAFGFLTRGCPRGCEFCIVANKEGRKSIKVADLTEFWQGQRNIELLDPNILACSDHLDLLQQLVDCKAYINFSQGLDIRLITEDSVALLNQMRVKRLHFAWDDPSDDLVPCFERFTDMYKRKDRRVKIVYVLTNFGSTPDQDLYRIYTLRDLGYDPYVMIYDKPHAPRDIRRLQRWCNNRRIFRKCPDFGAYTG